MADKLVFLVNSFFETFNIPGYTLKFFLLLRKNTKQHYHLKTPDSTTSQPVRHL